MKSPTIYNQIGSQYARNRIPDQRIAMRIWNALGSAKSVCNVGAGSGSYEPTDRKVVAVEPSDLMISQRINDHEVVQATAESLPFEDQQFDAAMTVLSIHHWNDFRQGLAEMKRVSHRQVIFTFDPEVVNSLWLVRDYLPEISQMETSRAPTIKSIVECLGDATAEIIPVPWDCTDGFQAAYWRRPEEYLKPEIRLSISSLAQLPEHVVERGMKQLQEDLESGVWHSRYRNLIQLDREDFGYRLIVSR